MISSSPLIVSTFTDTDIVVNKHMLQLVSHLLLSWTYSDNFDCQIYSEGPTFRGDLKRVARIAVEMYGFSTTARKEDNITLYKKLIDDITNAYLHGECDESVSAIILTSLRAANIPIREIQDILCTLSSRESFSISSMIRRCFTSNSHNNLHIPLSSQ